MRQFEGVTFDRDTNTILVVDEQNVMINLIDSESLDIGYSLKIPGVVNGGFEGIS